MSSRARPTEPFEAFRSELARLWRADAHLIVERTVGSTNSAARERLREGGLERPVVVFAWEQTEGRGRRGRRWLSPEGGGVWASIGLPRSSGSGIEHLPLIVPVVLARALRELGVETVGLKWPNDLMVDGRKLGGLIVEAQARGGRSVSAVVGVGINFRRPRGDSLGRAAVGIAELVEPPPALAAVGRALIEPLVEALRDPGDLDDLVERYRELSIHQRGDRLSCRTATETAIGDFIGFDDRGHLRLAVASGERRITSGEIVEG